ncbi:MAG: cytochrome c biogenesis protein CcdA [Leadbetterella sp.]
MRQLITCIFLLFWGFIGYSQIKEPTKWSFDYSPKQFKKGETIDIIFKAKIDPDWYIYSNDFKEDLGPTPTTVIFNPSSDFSLQGKLMGIHAKKKFDPVWEGDITYFEKTGEFRQKIKTNSFEFSISGKLDYQTCTNVGGQCVPGKKAFDILVKSEQESKLSPIDTNQSSTQTSIKTTDSAQNQILTDTNKVAKTVIKPIETGSQTGISFGFLITAFLAGLASIFMPCIYPIMPMTISFFTKQTNGKSKAILYGVFIMLIFASMGLVTMQLGAPFLNFLSTHWIPNSIFFLVFIVFGISLLGAFEIVLPASTVNKVDRLGDKGGILGIFFMALALVLISFSCTVPFVGSILINASQGAVLQPLYGMLAFGLPFAIVFGGLAMFPSLLKSLPKSGGWLGELKKVFGFMEFALALKFLSTIDLTRHWNILDRNIFLGIWIVLSTIIFIYIMGWMRLGSDTKVEKYAPGRIFFASLFFGFTIYLFVGLANKPLSLLSGILPPMKSSSMGSLEDPRMSSLIHNLAGFHKMEDAIDYSKKINKPIFLDFTGEACANCRKMEEQVWIDKEILNLLKTKFVIASLYVDDTTPLPVNEQYISKYDGDKVTTLGGKNMDYEITKFNNNAQPYYFVVNPNGEILSGPMAYGSKENFKAFLMKGLNKK